jgi:hypothetical protein
MNRVHELGKRSGAFGQPREVQPFLIIQNSLRSSFEPISQLPATQPILLILGVNEVREALVRVSVTRRVSRR